MALVTKLQRLLGSSRVAQSPCESAWMVPAYLALLPEILRPNQEHYQIFS